MNPEVLKILTYILAALSLLLLTTSIILFFKFKIIETIRELRGKVVKTTRKNKNATKSINDNVEEDDDEEGFDATVALVANEDTYLNFNIIKNIVYVNTAEIIE